MSTVACTPVVFECDGFKCSAETSPVFIKRLGVGSVIGKARKADAEAMAGWTADGDDHFCPVCSAARRGE